MTGTVILFVFLIINQEYYEKFFEYSSMIGMLEFRINQRANIITIIVMTSLVRQAYGTTE